MDFHCSLTFDKIGHLSTSTHFGVLQDYSHPSHSEFITSFWSSPPWCRNDANTRGTYACCLYLCLLYLLIFVISTAKYECKFGITWLIQWSWSWIALYTHLRTINMDTGDPASLAVFPGHNLISETHCWPGTPLSWVTINFTHSVACDQHLTLTRRFQLSILKS